MNFIAIRKEWIDSNGTIELIGRLAQDLIERHDLKLDLELKGVIIDAEQIELKIEALTNNFLKMRIIKKYPAKILKNIYTCVAISRPQTIKKILELSATFGVAEVHFIRTANTVKSYLDSKVFGEKEIEKHLIKGIEQGGLGRLPKVYLHKSYKFFITNSLPALLELSSFSKYIATPESEQNFEGNFDSEQSDFFIALGPESGFLSNEIQDFLNLKFTAIHLGDSILRLETAYTLMVGRLY
jgi:16S rRNA (uracil1498-N3)-methyltransferase